MSKKKLHTTPSPTRSIKIIQKNKKAFFEYEILDKLECGIILLGPEVKSIKDNKLQFADSFARIAHGKLNLHNLHISPYTHYTDEAIDSLRIRQLLVHKEELRKLIKATEEKGRSLVPLSIYLKHGIIKLELGVGRGKKLYDKKDAIKAKDLERAAQREARDYFRK